MDNKESESSLPLVSIIMPVYNTAAFLPAALDSILAQTYPAWEAILVDDGSTDDSGAICDSYAARDRRFRVIHKINAGVSAARNIGLDAARGEYIGFVDSDDWADPAMIATMVDDLERNDADVAKCGFRTVEQDRTHEPSRGPFRIIDGGQAARLLYENKKIRSFLWDKLYRRSIFNVRFPEGRVYEDMHVLLWVLANAREVTVNSKPLYNYRQRGDSIVHTGTIDNKRQLTDAFEERYHQVMRMKVGGWSARDKKKVYILEILKVCRAVVRFFPHTREADAFLNDMRERLRDTSPGDISVLGPKYMLWLMTLKISPAFFRGTLKATGMKKKKENTF